MRTPLSTVLVALLLAAPAAVHGLQAAGVPRQATTIEETQIDRDTRAIAAELRCVVCQGLSLQDSPSELAQEMRAVIREQLASGKSKAEVREYFIDRYGEWVLLQPTARGFNLIVYVVPVLLLLAGALFVYFTARKWTRTPPGVVPPAGTPDDTVHVG
jgi:cytochrome c-type biogenesis protein CcmH